MLTYLASYSSRNVTVARKYFTHLVAHALPRRSAKGRDSLLNIFADCDALNSRQSLKKFVWMNNAFGSTTSEATFTSLFNRALAKGSENGTFDRPKGMFPHRLIQHVMVCKSWRCRSSSLHLVPCVPSRRCVELIHPLLRVANTAIPRCIWPGEACKGQR